MDTIIIYEADGTPWKTVKISANCYYRDALEGDESVELRWEAYDYAKIPVGSYVNIEGRVYRLTEPHEPTRRTESIYTFAPVFYSQTYHWKKAMACLYEYGSAVTYTDTDNTISATIPEPTSRELDWSFTGNLPDALFMLIQMIKNETGVVWNAHYAAEVADTLIEFVSQGSSIFDFMSKIAEQCKKEFHFDYSGATPVVNIGTLEIEAQGTHTSEGRVLLNVGEDVSNPSVQSEAEEYFTRFYFFGSTRNIVQPNSVTKSSVVNRRLPLCPSKVTTSGYNDMNYYPKGFIDIDRKPSSYSDREYIPDLPPYKVFSKSIFFDDIYPRSDLKIQSVQTRHIAVIDDAGAETGENMPIYYVKLVNESGAAFNFNSGTYPNGDMLPTLVPSIAFRSGYLQGLEYELIYHATDFTVNTTGTEGQGGRVTIQAPCFEIVFDTNSNPRLPNDNIKPQVNDKCTLFNIHMPQEYIWNAQKELEQKAIEYIDDLNVDKSTYELNSNPLAFESFVALGNLQVGSLVKMVYPNGETIKSRVISIERHLDIPCDCKITLGYSARQGTIQTLRQVIEDTSANVESVVKEGDKTKAQLLGLKNGYLAQKEVFDSTFDADGYFDGSRIKPLTVETKALSVGSRSQQFTLSGVQLSVAKYTTGNGTLSWDCTNGKLAHLSLDEDNILVWPMAKGTQALNDANSHYIYAKVAKDGFGAASGGIKTNSNSGTFVATAEQKKFDSDQDYYYFLVGTISSVQTDSGSSYKTRIISLTYGTTTINGKQIQTGVIRSSDGSSVIINLDEGTITGNIQFLSGGQAVDAEQYINNTVNDAVSEIEIGGRNLLAFSNPNFYKDSAGGLSVEMESDGWLHVTGTLSTTGYIVLTPKWGNFTEANTIAKNDKYTLTIEERLESGKNGLSSKFYIQTYAARIGTTDYDMQVLKYSAGTLQLDYTGRWLLRVTCFSNSGGNGTQIDTRLRFKLEKGNKATDWTPATEDVDAGISNAQSAAAAAQQSATSANNAISTMNSDSYFSIGEKKAFRPEWKAISGYDNTTTTPTTSTNNGGSYIEAVKAASGTTVSTTALGTAFDNLKTFLNTYKLYTAEDTNWGTSGQSTLGTRTKAYYDAVDALYDAVAEYWANYAVANIKIGGKNLVFRSATMPAVSSGLNGWRASGGVVTHQDLSTPPTPSVSGAIRVTNSGSATTSVGMAQDNHTVNFKKDDELTESFYIRASSNLGNTYVRFQPFWVNSSHASGSKYVNLTTEWQLVSHTLKVTADYSGTASLGYVYIDSMPAGAWFEVCALKVEQGNKATDWSPAPEDVDAGISTAQTAAANAQQAANNAQTTINNMDSDSYFSTVEKKSFRPEWKAICGVDNTTTTPTASSTYGGSYEQALKAAQGTTVSTTAMTSAFGNLRGHLNTYKLYTNENTNWGTSGQTTLATYVKAYYNAEQAFYDALADYWSEVKAQQAVNNLQIGGINLFENSSFKTDFAGWSISGSGASITTVDGRKCCKISGTKGATTTVGRSILAKVVNDKANEQIYTTSGFFRLSNYSAGTTNPFVNVGYFGGSYNNGGTSTWLGASYISMKIDGVVQNITNADSVMAKFVAKNNAGWCYFELQTKIPATPTAWSYSVYGRDFTGDFCFYNIKHEKGNKATDWSPAPEDRNYNDIVANLTATCASAQGATEKEIICPDLTAKMLTDSKMRMRIKFTNANTASTFKLVFRNVSGGAAITPINSGATTSNVRLWYSRASSSYLVSAYWIEGQEIELKYEGVKNEYSGGTSVHLSMTDEAAFTTTMAFSKAMKGKTEVKGGLILTNVVQAGEGSAQAGMSGLSETDVAFWAGDNIGNAQLLLAPVVIMRDGRAKFGILRFDENGNISMPINGKSRLNILSGGLPPTNISTWTGNQWGKTGGTTSSGTDYTSLMPYDYGLAGESHNGMVVSVTGGGYLGLKSTSGTQTIGELAIVVQAGINKVVAFKVTGVTLTTTVQYFSLSGVNTEVSYGYDSNHSSISLIASYSGLTAPVAITFASNTSGGTSGDYGIHAQWYSDNTTPITNIANNGLLVLLKNTDMFQVKEVNGALTTTIKGKTDMPGVLWAGTISAQGEPNKAYGNVNVTLQPASSSPHPAAGSYNFALSGLTNAPVAPIAIASVFSTSSNGWTAKIYKNNKTEIQVRVYNNNTAADSNFNLLILGSN